MPSMAKLCSIAGLLKADTTEVVSTATYSMKYSSPLAPVIVFIGLHLISCPDGCFYFSLLTGIQWREWESEQSFIPRIAVV